MTTFIVHAAIHIKRDHRSNDQPIGPCRKDLVYRAFRQTYEIVINLVIELDDSILLCYTSTYT